MHIDADPVRAAVGPAHKRMLGAEEGQGGRPQEFSEVAESVDINFYAEADLRGGWPWWRPGTTRQVDAPKVDAGFGFTPQSPRPNPRTWSDKEKERRKALGNPHELPDDPAGSGWPSFWYRKVLPSQSTANTPNEEYTLGARTLEDPITGIFVEDAHSGGPVRYHLRECVDTALNGTVVPGAFKCAEGWRAGPGLPHDPHADFFHEKINDEIAGKKITSDLLEEIIRLASENLRNKQTGNETQWVHHPREAGPKYFLPEAFGNPDSVTANRLNPISNIAESLLAYLLYGHVNAIYSSDNGNSLIQEVIRADDGGVIDPIASSAGGYLGKICLEYVGLRNALQQVANSFGVDPTAGRGKAIERAQEAARARLISEGGIIA